MPKHEQRIALVTGANKGIGFEVVRQLAQKGYHVFLSARDEKAGRIAADELEREKENHRNGEVIFLQIDISEPRSIRRAANKFAKHCDRLDALINNAGILLDDDENVLTITPEIFDITLRTNTLGALLLAQAFVPFLKKSDAPRIINVSSSSGQLAGGADGWAPVYSTSKTALNGVTIQLAAALPKFAVNSVCPGWVRTDMGGSNAARSVAAGAAGVVWLATAAPQSLTGTFVRDREVIPW